MKKVAINILTLLGTLLPWTLSAHAAVTGQYTLEKVVMLSRHGVRPETNTKKITEATGKIWPEWNVSEGHLTGHGYTGIVNQAHGQLSRWQQAGLVLSQPCPTNNDVFVWSSPLQRTQATAQAFLDGMFPGCGLAAEHSKAKKDPLFQAKEMGISPPDKEKVKQQILERMGGSEALARQRYQPAIRLLQQAVCARDNQHCLSPDEPWILTEKEGVFSLKGPISAGASIAETIRLQYSEGLPLSQVAFGHVKEARDVTRLMALHAAKYDLISDTPELARHGGTLLMEQLVQALADNRGNKALPDNRLQAPVVIFVGHDTNIAQIQTMLDFNWQLPGYPGNDIPPGGSLVFERYRDNQTGQRFIHLTFTAMSLDQWRNLSHFDASHLMPSADYSDKTCHRSLVGFLCPLQPLLQKMIDSQVEGVTAPQPLYQ